MKKKLPARLMLARETLLQLSKEDWHEFRGGSGATTDSVLIQCSPHKPQSYGECRSIDGLLF